MSGSTIPLLPCESLDETLTFWQVMGFKVTYKQKAPNPYASISYEDEYEIHFFGLKQLKPQDNYSGCLVIVPEVEQLHATFSERLKTHLGKVPNRGFPRLSRMKPKQTRFTLTDINGNYVIFIKQGMEDDVAAQEYLQPGQTSLQKALSTAARLRDFHNDDSMAAKVLDNALAHVKDATPVELAKALIARIELSVALDDPVKARALYTQFKKLELSESEHKSLAEEISLLKSLETSIKE